MLITGKTKLSALMKDPALGRAAPYLISGGGFSAKQTPKEAANSPYNLPSCMDENYPPCYILCCADDPVVPPQNARQLAALLQQQGTPVQLEIAPKGGHGFGEGVGTTAEGWLNRATTFIENLEAGL